MAERRLKRPRDPALPASHYGRPWLDVPFEDGSSKGLAFGLAFALPNAVHILTIDLLDGHDGTVGFEADGISDLKPGCHRLILPEGTSNEL